MATKGRSNGAIALLKEDHKRVRALFARLEKTTERATDTRQELLDRIEQEIRVHTTIEEEIFYPAYKEAVSKREDEKLYHEALEEHHCADTVLTEMKASALESDEFSAKGKVLKDLVEHHAEEEETQMFPRAQRVMETSRLSELGTQMKERKRELEEGYGAWIVRSAGKLMPKGAGKLVPKGAAKLVPKARKQAGKLIAAVAESVAASAGGSRRSRSQTSAAARGAAPRTRARKAAKTRSRAKSAAPKRGRTKSTRSKKR